jgi:hypothetical protein
MVGAWRFDEEGNPVRVPMDIPCNPMVGIFWFIKEGNLEEAVIDAVPFEQGVLVDGVLQHGDHYEFWQSLEPVTAAERQLKASQFDYYTRGRVVYDPESKKFLIFADLCISAGDLNIALEWFDCFGDFDFEIMDKDDRYQYRCAQCSPN